MRVFIIAVLVLLVAAPAMAAYYVAGDFNSWNPAGNLMTETSAGFWSVDLTGITAGRHEFKITNGTWSENWPGPNSWMIVDATGNVTVTYDSNTHADGWVNSTKRIGVSADPGTWTAVGDWQGWSNNDPATAMTSLGGGIYYYQANIPVRTTPYQYKAVVTGSWDAIGADARSVNASTVQFNVTAGHTQWGFWVNALTGVVKARSLPESPVAYDGMAIPTDFNGLLRATQQNPTDFGDNTGDSSGSELDGLFVARGSALGGDGLYIGITGNLETNGNAYVILLDTAPGAGTNTVNALAGPDALTGLNGTVLDAGFAPKWAVTVNNAGGTTYVDLTDLTTNINYYLGNSQVDSGQGALNDGGGPSPALASFNNTNHFGVTSDSGAIGDPTTAVKGLEVHIPFDDLSLSTIPANIGVQVILCAGGGTEGSIMSNQTLPGLGGGYVSSSIPRGGATLDFGSFPGDQYATFSTASSLPYYVTVDGADIQTEFSGYQVALQDNHTDWGDRTKEHGSEIDQLYAGQDGNALVLGITGNLKTNGDFWVIFLESGSGGQSILDVPIGVGPQSGVLQGLAATVFDAGFAPTHVLCLNNSGACHADLVDLRTGTGRYLGSSGIDGGIGILGADNPLSAQVAFNNTNILGVTDLSAAGASTATTGAEIYLPFGYLGGAACTGSVKVCAWLVSNKGDRVSNQVLPSFPADTTGLGIPLDFTWYEGDQFATLTVSGGAFTTVSSVAAAKTQANGTAVHLQALVSASFGNGSFCVQDPASPMGILVNWYAPAPATGSLVDIDGYLSAAPVYGMRCIEACSVTVVAPPSTTFAKPYAMRSTAVGGVATEFGPGIDGASGANNTGSLVKVWGRVTYVDPFGYFYLDDGAGKNDGSTHDDGTGTQVPSIGVRIVSSATVSLNDLVSVVGISDTFTSYDVNGAPVRHAQVRTEKAEDVKPLP